MHREGRPRQLPGEDSLFNLMSFSWSAVGNNSPSGNQSGKRPKTSHYNENISLIPVSMSENSTITSWDIDGGLAADFDGSLSGLGADLGSTTYNMSEALLALPVFKQENLDNGFQYILAAATSPAVKVNEETLTYLNQGQSYEIKLKRLGDLSDCDGQFLRSTVRVCFHERRLQYMEKEQLDQWMATRPGERILDIDIPLSYGLINVMIEPTQLNAADFIWDPTTECGIHVKVNCISTEFTAKKHGGEKGVPFRIQIETRASEEESSKLIHCASCQIKSFKPKGADRKHKTDREKMDKRTGTEKEKYQPSYECTVLTEVPVEQVLQVPNRNGLTSVGSFNNLTQAFKDQSISPASNKRTVDQWQWQQPHCASSGSPPGASYVDSTVASGQTVRKPHISSSSASSNARMSEPSSPSNLPESSSPVTAVRHKRTNDSANLPEPLSPLIIVPNSLCVEANATEVTTWLKHNRFSHYINVFQNFAGADLLRLTRDDLIQICGLADGIRLNNALQSRNVRPRLTVYMCQEPSTVYHAVYLEQLTSQEMISKISETFKVTQYQIGDTLVQGPSAIHILLTDQVVRNFQEQSRFWLEITKDKENPDVIHFLIKIIE